MKIQIFKSIDKAHNRMKQLQTVNIVLTLIKTFRKQYRFLFSLFLYINMTLIFWLCNYFYIKKFLTETHYQTKKKVSRLPSNMSSSIQHHGPFMLSHLNILAWPYLYFLSFPTLISLHGIDLSLNFAVCIIWLMPENCNHI